jgi:hypothetical protein
MTRTWLEFLLMVYVPAIALLKALLYYIHHS